MQCSKGRDPAVSISMRRFTYGIVGTQKVFSKAKKHLAFGFEK